MSENKVDLSGVNAFDKSGLKKVDLQEKTYLPSKADMAAEKTMSNISEGKFNLKKTETVEKNALPTQKDIEAEKNA
jgi:hypothetical protein